MQINSINSSTNFGVKLTNSTITALNNGLSLYENKDEYKSLFNNLKSSNCDCTIDVDKYNSINITFPVTKQIAFVNKDNGKPYISLFLLKYMDYLVKNNLTEPKY